jgi:hypothetical protein
MPDKFDPYREALIVEESTNWPDELEDLSAEERAVIERQLHADPESAAHLTYVRVHTGFCREIVVTPEDVQRLRSASA